MFISNIVTFTWRITTGVVCAEAVCDTLLPSFLRIFDHVVAGLPLIVLRLNWLFTVTDAGLAAFEEVPLENLSLMGCGFTDEGIRSLVGMRNLTKLDLRDCKITEGVLPTLQKLPLVYLRVTQGVFTDAGIEGLRRAVPSLEELVLAAP